jgi:CHAT domain-containing protein/TPR repeat protein
MQKNLFNFWRDLEGLRRINLKIVFCGIMFFAVPQSLAFETEKNPGLSGKSIFNSRISETPLVWQNIRELEPGEVIERQAEANEKQSYSIKLEAGESVIVTIPKHSMAIAAKIYAPNGEQIGQIAQQQAEMIIQPIVIAAEKGGDYRIDVFCSWSGFYSINSGKARAISETDKKHSSAQKLYVEYLITLPNNPTIPSKEKITKRLEKLQERAAIYRAVNDLKLVALSLTDLAVFYGFIGEYPKMLDSYEEALALLKSTGSVADECSVLFALANDASQRKGDFQKAIDYLNRALSASRAKSYKNGEAAALHQLGMFYHLLGDDRKALDFYGQSLIVLRSINPPTSFSILNEASALSSIGNFYRSIKDDQKLIDYFNSGTLEDRQKAIEYYNQALEIYRKVKNSKGHRRGFTGEAETLLVIGNTYKELGDYPKSLNCLEQSLTLFNELKYRKGQVEALISIGNLYSLKGDYPKSFDYFEQAMIFLDSNVDNGNQAVILNIIGKDYYRAGKIQKATDLHIEALTLSRKREQQIVSAAALFEIARIERDLGNFANARNRIEESIEIVESVRAKITSQELRTTYFATVKRYYDFYIDLLMQAHKSQPEKGFDALALQTSEKARSRSLLDLLSQARIDIRQGVDYKLLEREQQARERLIEKAYQQSRLLLAKHTKEEAEKIEAEIITLTNEYQTVQSEIKNKSPRYAALTQPTSLNAKQIQGLLDSGTILLEYSLGEKKSYLWMITSDSIASFDLPKRDEIEAQAKKVYELLTARNENPKGETDVQRSLRIKAAEEQYGEIAAKLSEILLAPVVSQIGDKRLLIVPDGALNYIPFSALPSPKEVETADLRQPLGINHEIVTLPSASILALLREEIQSRKPAPKMLAVFADPVFNQTDVRANSAIAARTRGDAKQRNAALKTNTEIEKPSFNRDFERAVSDVGLRSDESGGLPRLPFSRREADSIFRVAPKNLSLKEVDFDASKTSVFESNLEQYRILHFATHGLLNSQHPELSGIVLSLVNKKGSDIDGFLRLQDIYNLKLSADLVVLSACNTALGKDVKGEGLIGLTRGFMYAGAPRVVASLWKVDDAATAEFMSIFYRKMLGENLRPAAALRAAQTEMMKQTRWKSPYYWAPFIIQGEWK